MDPTFIKSVFGSYSRLSQIKHLCRTGERGVFKRIDENRELLEFLQQESPDLLRRCPWVEGWIESQDRFLVDLARLVQVEKGPAFENRPWPWPRPWPGCDDLAERARARLDAALRARVEPSKRGTE